MKLLIDGEYSEVGFFSFLKCYALIQLFLFVVMTFIFFMVGVFLA